jgi:hypothetical protein
VARSQTAVELKFQPKQNEIETTDGKTVKIILKATKQNSCTFLWNPPAVSVCIKQFQKKHHDLLTNKSESNKTTKPLAHTVSPSNSGWLRGKKKHISLSLNNRLPAIQWTGIAQ